MTGDWKSELEKSKDTLRLWGEAMDGHRNGIVPSEGN